MKPLMKPGRIEFRGHAWLQRSTSTRSQTPAKKARTSMVALSLAVVALLAVASYAPSWGALAPEPSSGNAALAGAGTPQAPAAGAVPTSPRAAVGPSAATAFPIDGDDQLLERAQSRSWPGTGTADDPILMSGLDIQTTNRTALRLRDTTLHVVIADALLLTDGNSDALFLDNVANVRVTGGELSGGVAGIRVRSSSDVTLHDLTLLGGRYGVLLHEAHNVEIHATSFLYSRIGIYADTRADLLDSSRINVHANNFVGMMAPSGGGAAIALHGAHHRITGNDVHASETTGIWVLSDHTVVEQNVVHRAAGVGILVSDSRNVTVADNHVNQAGIEGIGLFRAVRTTIAQNQLAGNAIGIGTRDDHQTTITENTIINGARGIVLSTSSGARVHDNSLQNHQQSIDVAQGTGIILQGNDISQATMGGINVFSSNQTTIKENRLHSGTNIGIFVGLQSQDAIVVRNTISGHPRAVVATDSVAVQVTANELHGAGFKGIEVSSSSNVQLRDNNVKFFDQGISLTRNHDAVRVLSGLVSHNFVGIWADGSGAPAQIYGTEIVDGTVGIHLVGLAAHTVHAAFVHGNAQGILLQDARNAQIAHARIWDNRIGLHLTNATQNLVFDNYIVNDALPGDRDFLMERSPGNQWNVTREIGPNIMGGPWIGGNVWSDYRGADADGDGFGDVPYSPVPAFEVIQGETPIGPPVGPIDLLPLVKPERNERDSALELPVREEPQNLPDETASATSPDDTAIASVVDKSTLASVADNPHKRP